MRVRRSAVRFVVSGAALLLLGGAGAGCGATLTAQPSSSGVTIESGPSGSATARFASTEQSAVTTAPPVTAPPLTTSMLQTSVPSTPAQSITASPTTGGTPSAAGTANSASVSGPADTVTGIPALQPEAPIAAEDDPPAPVTVTEVVQAPTPTVTAEPAPAAPLHARPTTTSRTSTSTPTTPTSSPMTPTSSPTTTSTSQPAPAVEPPPVSGVAAGKVVVIDPGHNGANGAHPEIITAQVDAGFGQTKDCNTTGTQTNDGYPEHAFAWSVALSVKASLEAQGVTVVMTRSSDDGVGPCVNQRAAIGNDNQADAVLSIHGDGSAEGNRGFYAMTSERDPASAEMAARSADLAATVRDSLLADGLSASNYLGSNGLWKRADLAGLNLSQRPTTMVELGNMRDSQDSALMSSASGRQQVASALAAGVLGYLANL